MKNFYCAVLLAGFVLAAEALDFVGKYESTDKRENTAAFAAAAKQDDITEKIINEFTRSGDDYHHKFSVPSKNYVQDLPFKLNEEKESAHDGKTFKYKYVVDGDKLKANFDMQNGKHVEQVYEFNAEGFVKIYKIKDVVAKVWFKKV